MRYDEVLRQFDDAVFLDSVYGYAYRRCSDRFSAEDLCMDIICQALKAASRTPDIVHFHAFFWTVAHRVYADFSKNRKRAAAWTAPDERASLTAQAWENPMEEFVEQQERQDQLNDVTRRIAFLSKMYRDVMVMYYIDEASVADIASALHISANVVKQRLFLARKKLKKMKEAKPVQPDMTLKPMELLLVGNGQPGGNDPRNKLDRAFSKNLVYLCRKQPHSAQELSEKLNVPLPYVEEEIDIQIKGENGTYGMLTKAGDGKVVANAVILDAAEAKEGEAFYIKHMDALCQSLKAWLASQGEAIMSFPFLSQQDDLRFILWGLIADIERKFTKAVDQCLADEHFQNVTQVKRPFYVCGFAVPQDQPVAYDCFYGCDGVNEELKDYDLHGYKRIYITNIYGRRIRKHFGCGLSIFTDSPLLMTIRAIGGLDIASLTDDEKEVAAKAIACGYLRKHEGILSPNIIVYHHDHRQAFYDLKSGLEEPLKAIAKTLADEMAPFLKATLPKHLLHEYAGINQVFNMRLRHELIERSIEADLLTVPKNTLCGEGVVLEVG